MLCLVLATTLAVTPYATGIHFVLLVPAFVRLGRKWPLLALAYPAGWLPLARLVGGFELAWIDYLYPLLVLAGVWWIVLTPPELSHAARENRNVRVSPQADPAALPSGPE